MPCYECTQKFARAKHKIFGSASALQRYVSCVYMHSRPRREQRYDNRARHPQESGVRYREPEKSWHRDTCAEVRPERTRTPSPGPRRGRGSDFEMGGSFVSVRSCRPSQEQIRGRRETFYREGSITFPTYQRKERTQSPPIPLRRDSPYRDKYARRSDVYTEQSSGHRYPPRREFTSTTFAGTDSTNHHPPPRSEYSSVSCTETEVLQPDEIVTPSEASDWDRRRRYVRDRDDGEKYGNSQSYS